MMCMIRAPIVGFTNKKERGLMAVRNGPASALQYYYGQGCKNDEGEEGGAGGGSGEDSK